jgi:hypothetical protein
VTNVGIFLIAVDAPAVHFTILPFPNVHASNVGPFADTPALTLVIVPFSDILGFVGVIVGALAVKFIISLFSRVHASTSPLKDTPAVMLVIVPFPDIFASISNLDGVDLAQLILKLS